MRDTNQQKAWQQMKVKVLESPNQRIIGKPFTAQEVANIIHCDTQTASRLLIEMADKDYSISRTTPSQKNTLRFEKRNKTNLLTKSWRRIPNEVLLEELL